MSTPVDTAPASERVYDALEAALLAGEVSADARLTEPKVSAYFNVSRTPVREALSRLRNAGLLVRHEFGYAPTRPTLVGVRDLYELRLAIETAGIRRCADNPGAQHDLPMLRAELRRWHGLRDDPPPQHPGFVLEDERFHRTLLAAAGNGALVDALDAVNLRIRRVRMHDFMVNTRIETTISEHIAILDAVLAEALPLAERLLRKHIGDSLDVVLTRVSRAIASLDNTATPNTEIGRALR